MPSAATRATRSARRVAANDWAKALPKPALIKNDAFVHRTYNMGTVDANNHTNFYDGMVRVVGPDGSEHAKYHARDYQQYVAEHVEPWSYLKFPFLKKVGWKGFVDGESSGVYKATPLARLNAADQV